MAWLGPGRGVDSRFDWQVAVGNRPELVGLDSASRTELLERFERDAYDWVVGFKVLRALPTVAWYILVALHAGEGALFFFRLVLLGAVAWLVWLGIAGGLEPWVAHRVFGRWWRRQLEMDS